MISKVFMSFQYANNIILFLYEKSVIVFEYFWILLSQDGQMNFQKGKDITIYFLPIFNFLIYTFQARKIFAVGSNYFYTGRWGGFNSQFSPAFNVLTPMIFFTYNRFLTGLQT